MSATSSIAAVPPTTAAPVLLSRDGPYNWRAGRANDLTSKVVGTFPNNPAPEKVPRELGVALIENLEPAGAHHSGLPV